jgi:short-subunit dehydrogenase
MKKIFITGASSGMGACLAEMLSTEGTSLGLVARREKELNEVAQRCKEKGALVLPLNCDVTDTAAMKRAADDFIAWAHGVDCVVANAGIARRDRVRKGDAIDAARVVSINLVGAMNTLIPFVPSMLEAGSGILAATSSFAAFRAVPYLGAYSASKAGLLAFMDSLRLNLKGTGVKTVTLCPGYVRTALNEGAKKLPFELQPEEAAQQIVRALRAHQTLAVFPWQMAVAKNLIGLMPDDAFKKAAPGRPD